MQTHLIHELCIDAQAETKERGALLQNQIGFWVHTQSFRQNLENTLNNCTTVDEYLNIEELVVIVNFSDAERFQSDFLLALEHSIQESLIQNRDKAQSTPNHLLSRDNLLKQLFSHFLTTGIFPSNTPIELQQSVREILTVLPYTQEKSWLRELSLVATDNPYVWERLGFTIGRSGFEDILEHQFGTRLKDLVQNGLWDNDVLRNPHATKQLFQAYGALIYSLINGKPKEQAIKHFQKLLNGPTIVKKDDGHLNAHQNEQDLIVGNFLVQNAGLVLLWTRISKLFKQLDWVTNDAFKNEITQQKAIALLHYLAHGSEVKCWEDELVLPKLLVGWPLTKPLEFNIPSKDESRFLGEAMLASFLQDWMPQKRFSIKWFRESFLKRQGTLHQRPDGVWQLVVIAKTEDLLLNKLPPGTGISIIRYRWMESMLFVEW